MSSQQLQDSIELGQKILDGEANLVELDSKSLELRGKGKGMSGKASGKLNKSNAVLGKRKTKDRDIEKEEVEVENETKRTKKESLEPAEEDAKEKSHYFEPQATKSRKSSKQDKPKKSDSDQDLDHEDHSKPTKRQNSSEEDNPKATKSPPSSNKQQNPSYTTNPDLKPYLSKIALSSKTPFQKLVLTTLCQVPKGKYTTYGAISTHLSSSPRAVGNALRNNPFAPQVPCHRVLASGGGLGGFKGSWGKGGEEGLHDDAKRKLLREEGVRFDGKGRVVGGPWTGFV